jgi:acetyltransferase-like isoleucine patch superfamily enzyme
MGGVKDIHETAVVAPSVKAFGSLKVGPYSRIDEGCVFTGDVEIGARTHIAFYVVLSGKSGIRIGDYCGLAPFTAIFTEVDDYGGEALFGPCVPESFRKTSGGPVVIQDNVIVGARTTILGAVTLYKGCSVGAHSLVKTDCFSDLLYAGTPAREIKKKSLGHWTKRYELEHGIL